MLIIDRQFDGVFFVPGDGGAPLLYEHLSSIFLAGAYISVVIGALGTISEILPTFARQPHFGQRTITPARSRRWRSLAVLAWMQNMYAAPIPIGFLYFAMLMALAATVPVGLIVFNWIATLSGGAGGRMRAPMLFALGAVALIDPRPRRRARAVDRPGRLAARRHRRGLGRHPHGPDRRRRSRRVRGPLLLVPEAERDD